MSGFQFVHCQQFSRKVVAGKAGPDGVTRGGRASVRDVMAEAGREDGAALHVDSPLPPILVHGLDPIGVERLHDERVEAGRSEVSRGKSRKIRVDQATLLTVVASYPATVAECIADTAKARARDEWQARNVVWLQAEFGSRLVGVLRHDDEAYPHLHAYILPDDSSMKANPLHPGWSAKHVAKEAAEAAGADPKTANAAGDRAYRQAMRSFQDRYWEVVGLPSGLARVGPGRRRLTRDAWQAEQSVAATTARALEVARIARLEAVAAASESASVRSTAEAQAAELAERGVAFVASARAAAVKAVAQADAATLAAASACAAEASARSKAASLIAAARREASVMVAAAEVRAVKAKRVGAVLGSLWSGLAGVSRRIEAVADRRVEDAKAKAAVSVAGARADAVASVGGELVQLREQVVRASRDAIEARDRLKKAEASVLAERAGRLAAEREREDFRGRWADADNKNIQMQRGRRF